MTSQEFNQFLFGISEQPLTVLDPTFSQNDYIPLDLSISNFDLNTVDVSSAEKLETFIKHHISSNDGQVAVGGYLETRGIYRRSDYFNNVNPDEERNIHLGLDLWITGHTPVFAPLDGKVHSFKNNTNYGDYGPTIILEHNIQGINFYTLYGHLSLSSIDGLKTGQSFKKGKQIATLGDASVNGDYAPHLHFQIIKDMQNFIGDYPGVASKMDLEFYKLNCPDPNLLLKLNL